MTRINFTTFLAVLILLGLGSISFAQQYPEQKKGEPKPYTAIDAALTAGWAGLALGDRWSTNKALAVPGVREASPIKSANARMAIQFGLIGTVEFLQRKYPEHRTSLRIFKSIFIGVATGVVIHNLNKAH